MIGTYERRRGTAIVNTPHGIIIVRGYNPKSKFLLPGGKPKGRESRMEAAIRELREETGLIAYGALFLFEHQKSKVFFIKAEGTPTPHQEISQIEYYTPSCTLPVSYSTKQIINKYLGMKP